MFRNKRKRSFHKKWILVEVWMTLVKMFILVLVILFRMIVTPKKRKLIYKWFSEFLIILVRVLWLNHTRLSLLSRFCAHESLLLIHRGSYVVSWIKLHEKQVPLLLHCISTPSDKANGSKIISEIWGNEGTKFIYLCFFNVVLSELAFVYEFFP